jgi:hypothetical protein
MLTVVDNVFIKENGEKLALIVTRDDIFIHIIYNAHKFEKIYTSNEKLLKYFPGKAVSLYYEQP